MVTGRASITPTSAYAVGGRYIFNTKQFPSHPYSFRWGKQFICRASHFRVSKSATQPAAGVQFPERVTKAKPRNMTAVSATSVSVRRSEACSTVAGVSLALEYLNVPDRSSLSCVNDSPSPTSTSEHRSSPTTPVLKLKHGVEPEVEVGRPSEFFSRFPGIRHNFSSSKSNSLGQRDDHFAHRPIRVFCMLPLDVVNSEGVFRPAPWFIQALQLLANSGVHGVAVDVWWGAVERQPRQYNWTGYKQLFELVKSTGLKLQVVFSFHACGGNVGDVAQIPLPPWVLQAGEHDPDLFFTDRPRENGLGQRNKEYISIFADEAPGVLWGRSPLQCYEDFMVAFRNTFHADVGSLIEETVIGAGPCGELRYPSYVEANGWRFPGAGEFQCYDRRALASLAQAAREVGHPEWGYAGPHDSGSYNSIPEDTGFFSGEGSWDTPYGSFFLEWYSNSLIQHGERLLAAATQVFSSFLPQWSADSMDASGRTPRSEGATPGNILQSCGNFLAGFFGGNLSSLECGVTRSEGGNMEAEGSETNLVKLDTVADVKQGLGNQKSMFSSSTLADSADCVNTVLRMDPCNSMSSLSTDGNATSSFYNVDMAGLPDLDDCDVGMSSPEESDEVYLGRHAALYDTYLLDEARRRSNSGASKSPGHLTLTLKIAGIHWWYRSRSHAAELTAGYYNTDSRDGYHSILDLCAHYKSNLTLTCVEMCDAQHPPVAMCGPEGLLRQIRLNAAKMNISLSGENALPIFSAEGVDTVALERIVTNTKAWYGRSMLPSCTTLGNIVAAGKHLSECARPVHIPKELWQRQEPDATDPLPAMKSFTFLRLGPEILKPAYQAPWVKFLAKMQSGGY